MADLAAGALRDLAAASPQGALKNAVLAQMGLSLVCSVYHADVSGVRPPPPPPPRPPSRAPAPAPPSLARPSREPARVLAGHLCNPLWQGTAPLRGAEERRTCPGDLTRSARRERLTEARAHAVHRAPGVHGAPAQPPGSNQRGACWRDPFSTHRVD